MRVALPPLGPLLPLDLLPPLDGQVLVGRVALHRDDLGARVVRMVLAIVNARPTISPSDYLPLEPQPTGRSAKDTAYRSIESALGLSLPWPSRWCRPSTAARSAWSRLPASFLPTHFSALWVQLSRLMSWMFLLAGCQRLGRAKPWAGGLNEGLKGDVKLTSRRCRRCRRARRSRTWRVARYGSGNASGSRRSRPGGRGGQRSMSSGASCWARRHDPSRGRDRRRMEAMRMMATTASLNAMHARTDQTFDVGSNGYQAAPQARMLRSIYRLSSHLEPKPAAFSDQI